jgi:hypothetical protein
VHSDSASGDVPPYRGHSHPTVDMPTLQPKPHDTFLKKKLLNNENIVRQSSSANELNTHQSKHKRLVYKYIQTNTNISTTAANINNLTTNENIISSSSKFVERTRQKINSIHSHQNKKLSKLETKYHQQSEMFVSRDMEETDNHSVTSEITDMNEEDYDEDQDNNNNNNNNDNNNRNNDEDNSHSIANGSLHQQQSEEECVESVTSNSRKMRKKKLFQPWRKLKPIAIAPYRPIPPPPSLSVHE